MARQAGSFATETASEHFFRRSIDKTGRAELFSGMKRNLCLILLAAALFAGGSAYYKIQPVSALLVQKVNFSGRSMIMRAISNHSSRWK
jgi:hypothetical protein